MVKKEKEGNFYLNVNVIESFFSIFSCLPLVSDFPDLNDEDLGEVNFHLLSGNSKRCRFCGKHITNWKAFEICSSRGALNPNNRVENNG